MEVRHGIHPEHAKQLDTAGLRNEFLVEKIFVPGDITMTYSHIDRIVFGGIMPLDKSLEISQEAARQIAASYFLERREMGVVNIGGPGRINLDGTVYELDNEEALYISRGTQHLTFESVDAAHPAKFYYNSCPAHASHPTKKIKAEDVEAVTFGEDERSNCRTVCKYIVPSVVETCQLTMGITKIHRSNTWNTMPCHTHDRRMEVYLYFNMDEESVVFHFMGEPTETRHIIMTNEQAVISPSWSIHGGAGTYTYSLLWGMVGENQEFTDMDHLALTELR